DRIPGVAPPHDHLVAAEERGHRTRLDDLPALEVRDGMEGQRPRHPSNRIEVDVPDVAVTRQELLDLLVTKLPSRAGLDLAACAERVRFGPKVRLAVRVELDREILEAHGRGS